MVPIVIAFLSSTHLFIVAIDGIGREKSITTSNNSVNSAMSEVKVILKLFSIEFILFVLVLPLVPHDHALAVRSSDPDGPAAVRLELAETDAHATS